MDKGKGTPLLMIHGLGGNATHWNRNIDELSQHYHCIALDLPGYGSSDSTVRADGSTQMDFYADIIIQLINKLHLKNVVLMGHSMGGQIAIITVLKQPSLFSKLILIGSAGLEKYSAVEVGLMKTYATPQHYFEQDSATVTKAYKASFVHLPPEGETMIKERLALNRCPGFYKYCQNISLGVQGLASHLVSDSLSFITLPTLIIFGDKDAAIPNKRMHPTATTIEVATNANKAIAGCKLVMIDDASHLVQFEKPKEVDDAIITFIDDGKKK